MPTRAAQSWRMIILITCIAVGCATHDPGKAAAQGTPRPESAIVRVNLEVGGHCTGFAVDKRTVATAAHCLWLQRPQNWIQPTSLHVLAGYDRGEYSQHLRVLSYRIAADYTPGAGIATKSQGGDWALLKLNAAFRGAPLPLAGRGPSQGVTLSLAGYAGTRRHRLTRHAACTVQQVGGGRFLHSCPAGRGHSGGPMFAWADGVRVAFGIHVASNRVRGLAVAAAAIVNGRSRQPY